MNDIPFFVSNVNVNYFWPQGGSRGSKESLLWQRVLKVILVLCKIVFNDFEVKESLLWEWTELKKIIIIIRTRLKYSFLSWIIKIVKAYLNWKAFLRSSEFRKNFESTWKKVHWINEWLLPNELSSFHKSFFSFKQR